MLLIDPERKTAIVTGEDQGLGEASVRRLHEAGSNVVVNTSSIAGVIVFLCGAIASDIAEPVVRVNGGWIG